ncbi:hypothetical protein D3C77_733500 [compost metagenome]
MSGKLADFIVRLILEYNYIASDINQIEGLIELANTPIDRREKQQGQDIRH